MKKKSLFLETVINITNNIYRYLKFIRLPEFIKLVNTFSCSEHIENYSGLYIRVEILVFKTHNFLFTQRLFVLMKRHAIKF